MNAVAEIARPKNEIVAQVEATPSLVLVDKQKFSQFYEAMKEECEAHTPDLTTEKGRKAIASLAYKVARTKTAIDDAGKQLTEEARATIKAVDESRREIRQQLDALKDEVRRPLTEWEQAEEARVDRCKQTLVLLRDSATVGYEETAEDVRKRLRSIEDMGFSDEGHGGYLPQMLALKEQTMLALNAAVVRLEREEQERAELERLRAEAAERARIEQERAAAEEAKRQKEAAEKAEAERKAAVEAAEKARLEAAAKAAEERAKAEAERKAREEREATERAHAEALAAERRRAEEAERAAQAERDRIAREEAARKAAAEAEAAEQARRDADQKHRTKVMSAAKQAIMTCGATEETARAIVLAIKAGEVPGVTIRF